MDAPARLALTGGGWTGRAEPRPRTTTIATSDVGDGDGRSALHDSTGTQTRDPLRTRRTVVRGSLGERVDDTVVRLVDARTVVTSRIERRQTGHHQDVQGADLDHLSSEGGVVFRNPFVGARLDDQEIAPAVLLQRTAARARGQSPGPYPLAEAAQDQLLAPAVGRSPATGGPVTTGVEAWGRV
ncbi:hypothetical protein [Kineococcus sp. SYSU DK002]|uniref:hypothetical protein n=1 Tax=Kineococcus sp. SYSU DK002 TaxID=3383123 RepID=UPI003D7DEF65